MFFHLTALISLFIFVLYLHFKRRYKFWKDLNVLYPEPTFPTGNVSDFLKSSIHFSYVIQKLYVKLKQLGGDDYGGIYFFGNPVFLVLSPEFAKTVLVRDFHYFHDRGIYFNLMCFRPMFSSCEALSGRHFGKKYHQHLVPENWNKCSSPFLKLGSVWTGIWCLMRSLKLTLTFAIFWEDLWRML